MFNVLLRASALLALSVLSIWPSSVLTQQTAVDSPVSSEPVNVEEEDSMELLKQKIDSLVLEQMRIQQLPGLALAVLIDGKPFYLKGYGKADIASGRPVATDTLFGIGSCTKAMTAFAVMQLVQEGRINLNKSVRSYLPGPPPQWQSVTIRHLLSHTSGIPLHSGPHLPWGAVWSQMAGLPLRFEPGERTEYNNFGFIVLSRVIEEVSGQSYDQFINNRLFIPLAMNSTGIPDMLYPPGLATGYKTNGTVVTPNTQHRPWIQMGGAGGVVSSITDLAKWDMAMTRGELLTPASYKQMWTPVMLNNGRPSGWCLGWQISRPGLPLSVSKDGGIAGYRSTIIRHIDEGVNLIFLSNTSPAHFGPMAKPIIQAIKDQKNRSVSLPSRGSNE